MERYLFLFSFFFAGPLLRHAWNGRMARVRACAFFPRFRVVGESDSQIHPVPEVIGQGSHEHAFSMHSREGYSTRADLVRRQRGVTGSRWLVHEAPLHHLFRLPACTRGPTARSLLQPLRAVDSVSRAPLSKHCRPPGRYRTRTRTHALSLFSLFLSFAYFSLPIFHPSFSSRFRKKERKKSVFFLFFFSLCSIFRVLSSFCLWHLIALCVRFLSFLFPPPTLLSLSLARWSLIWWLNAASSRILRLRR